MSVEAKSIEDLLKKVEKAANAELQKIATERVKKWQGIVETDLRQEMETTGYMTGNPVLYQRTGEYPTHTRQGSLTYAQGAVEGTVDYTPYHVAGKYGQHRSVELTGLLESGYQVRTPAWYNFPASSMGRTSGVVWRFDFRRIPYFGKRPPATVRANVVSRLAGSAAAEGVKLILG